jgi:hypothetical protein
MVQQPLLRACLPTAWEITDVAYELTRHDSSCRLIIIGENRRGHRFLLVILPTDCGANFQRLRLSTPKIRASFL